MYVRVWPHLSSLYLSWFYSQVSSYFEVMGTRTSTCKFEGNTIQPVTYDRTIFTFVRSCQTVFWSGCNIFIPISSEWPCQCLSNHCLGEENPIQGAFSFPIPLASSFQSHLDAIITCINLSLFWSYAWQVSICVEIGSCLFLTMWFSHLPAEACFSL